MSRADAIHEEIEGAERYQDAVTKYLDWLRDGVDIVRALEEGPQAAVAELPEPPKPRRKAGPAKPKPTKSAAQPPEKKEQKPRADQSEADARRQEIVSYLNEHGPQKAATLVEELQIKKHTVREDLRKLQERDLIEAHGLTRRRRYGVKGADFSEVEAQEPAERSSRPTGKRHAADPVPDRDARASAQQKLANDVVRWVMEHPNSTVKEIAAGTSMEQGECANLVRSLVRMGGSGAMKGGKRLWSDKGDPERFNATGHATQPDSRGARTRQERELVDAVEHDPGQDCEHYATLLKRAEAQLRGVMSALVRRQVLRVDAGRYYLGEGEVPVGPSGSGATTEDEGLHDEMEEAGIV